MKNQDVMLVKASGKRMRDVWQRDFFHQVRLTGGGRFIDDLPNSGTKPSIEVFLHALLPTRYVLHLHSTHAISALSNKSHVVEASLIEAGIQTLDYVRPGLHLGEAISAVIRKNLPRAILLRNHGIVLASDYLEEIAETLLNIETKFGTPNFPGQSIDVILETMISKDDLALEQVIWHAKHNWRITPDHVVFLGSKPTPEFSTIPRIRSLMSRIHKKIRDNLPITVTEEQKVWFATFALVTPRKLLDTLDENEALALTQWDAEKYRLMKSKT